jgi:O-acetyl-ADP-ribose deacetylase (regulator of RNase III)
MGTIKLIKGDITKQKTDVIVNAANSSLLGGGGVDGAIHKAGGKAILEECIAIRNRQGGCKTGEAVITTGGNLPAKYVIHTVGPVWNGDKAGKEQLLANAYYNCLALAVQNDVETIAFPNISTGVYNFPKDKAASIAVNTTKEFLVTNATIKEVVFVCYDNENYALYQDLLGN